MSDGWIKLHRSLIDHDIWTQEPFTRGQAWVDLLLLANHTQNQFRVRGNLVIVSRGEVARSEESLALRWKWSRNKVRRFIEELSSKTIQQIEQQKSPILNKIRIINYDLYQSNDPSETTDGTTERQQTEQQKDTNKNDKKEKNDKNEKNNTDMIEFGHFWDSYPKKIDKQGSIRSFSKAIKKTTLGVMLSALEKQKETSQWQKNEGQYIPNPTTWLNQERWNQVIEIEDTQSWEYLNRELLKGANGGQNNVAIGRDNKSL